MKPKVASSLVAILVVGSLVAWPCVARWRQNARRQSVFSAYRQPIPVDLPQEQRALRVPPQERLRTLFPQGALQILQQSPQLVLFSLEPNEDFDSTPPLFQRHHVLGKTVIRESSQKAALLASFYDGFVLPPSNGLKQISMGCFMPRHGIRATQNGHVVDLPICFSCRQFDVYLDGQLINHSSIGDSPRSTFNRILTQHHVALSK